jgi:hypothetical protein
MADGTFTRARQRGKSALACLIPGAGGTTCGTAFHDIARGVFRAFGAREVVSTCVPIVRS